MKSVGRPESGRCALAYLAVGVGGWLSLAFLKQADPYKYGNVFNRIKVPSTFFLTCDLD